MISEARSLLRTILLAALAAALLSSALLAPVGNAARAASPEVSQPSSTAQRATDDRDKIETQRVIYRNTFVRCPKKPRGHTVWDGDGKGGYPAGWYTCIYSQRWMTKLWYYHDYQGQLPCALPSSDGRTAADPPRISPKC